MTETVRTVVQVTDSHLLAEPGERLHGLDPDDTLRRVLIEAAKLAPDLVVASGDLTESADAAAYQRLNTLLAAPGLPVACLPGNHDRREVMANHLDDPGITMPDGVSLGNWWIGLLDSSVAGEPGGRLGRSRLAALDWQLKSHRTAHKLIFVHHQPVATDSPWIDAMGLADGEDLLDCLDADGATRAVAFGHIHHAFSGSRGGVQLFGTPATSFQARPRRPRFELDATCGPGFRWFRLHEDGLLDTGVTRLPAPAHA